MVSDEVHKKENGLFIAVLGEDCFERRPLILAYFIHEISVRYWEKKYFDY
jgi:hypothetical protein